MDSVVDETLKVLGPAGKGLSRVFVSYAARCVAYQSKGAHDIENLDQDAHINGLAKDTAAFISAGGAVVETLRLQVAFDAAYFKHHTELEAARSARAAGLARLLQRACSISKADAASYAGLTSAHDAVLQFVTSHTGSAASVAPPAPADREAVSGEIAAALESVFPRVGLPTFVALSDSEKQSQLEELAHLILGIRLFNWDVGSGGAGIGNVPGAALETVSGLAAQLDSELQGCSDFCSTYEEVLKVTAAAAAAGAPLVPPEQHQTWFAELVNRRQVCAYVGALLDEASTLQHSVEEAIAAFQERLDSLKGMVSGKGSVPKQAVYPQFHKLAELWLECDTVRRTAAARADTFAALAPFLPPAMCTLELHTARSLRQAPLPAAQPFTSIDAPSGGSGSEGKSAEGKSDDAPTAELLSLEGTPEFMHLPLEMQGYCPVALVGTGVSRGGALTQWGQGVLAPGDPSQGVVRVGQRYVVCSSQAAVQAFVAAPMQYLSAAVDAAAACPSLLHLLQLSAHLPHADLARLIQGGDAAAGNVAATGGATDAAPTPSHKKDAGVQTPVHFIEKNIVYGYTWNEWTLRQRALRLANLRNAATSSTQTDESHFKRESSTQVYLPRDGQTQTAVHQGTNPIKTVRYVTGLRGFAPVVRPAAPDAGAAAAAATAAANAETTQTRAKVVNLSFDLTELK